MVDHGPAQETLDGLNAIFHRHVKNAIESAWERQRKSGEKTCFYLKMIP